MFDTIILKASSVYIDPTQLHKFQQQSLTVIDTETGEYQRSYNIQDKNLPKIRYFESSKTMTLELSIPKFLYGNNVTLLQAKDIPLFFQRLNERLHQLFGILINKEEWIIIKRLDV